MNPDTAIRARWQRISRRTRLVLMVCFVVGIGLRLALPPGIKWYVNHQLKRAADYTGAIGDVSVHLWRGAYRIKDIKIFKVTGAIKEPLFAARQLDLSIEWNELFHGAVVGEVTMEQPQLNFVSGPTDEESQSGKNARWDQILASLFPFKLNRLEIHDGQIHFQNHYSKPPVDIATTGVSATATNLTNARDLKEELPAGMVARGNTLGHGSVDLQLRLNPVAELPSFEISCQLSNVDLVALNDFLMAYGKFDVERGRFSLYTSVAAKDGNYEGYFKTFFDDLDVFNWQKEKHKNPFQVAWEAVVGSAATLFKNQSKDSLATRIPISGTYKKGQVGIWSAVATLLRNAFISALTPKVDEQVTVKEVEKKVEKQETVKPVESPRASEGAPPKSGQ